MKQLMLHHHLGLGDHFICNGLVHRLKSELGLDRLVLPVKEHNIPTVRCLYQDHPDIQLLPVPKKNYPDEDSYVIRQSSIAEIPLLKISYGGGESLRFDESFYTQAGIEFSASWANFSCPGAGAKEERLFKEIVHDEKYCLIANSGSVGAFDLDIDSTLPKYYITGDRTENLLDWRLVIERASEIHCIDSAIIHLVDRIATDASKLVYHNVGRGSNFHLHKRWQRMSHLPGKSMKAGLKRVFDTHFDALPDEHIFEVFNTWFFDPRKSLPRPLRGPTRFVIRKARKAGVGRWRHACHYSFMRLLEEMADLKQPPRILETGSSAHGTNSSLLFFAVIDLMGGTFETVDLDPEATKRVNHALKMRYPHLLDRIHCHTMDSVELIRRVAGPLDVVYLDSYDLYPGIFKESEEHGLKEFQGVVDKLADSALVLIDDTPRTRSIFQAMNDQAFMNAVDTHVASFHSLPGKGALVLKEIAKDTRFEILYHEYQLLLRFRR